MPALKRYCLALDLKNDPELIAEYEAHHNAVWPEIKKAFLNQGSAIWKFSGSKTGCL